MTAMTDAARMPATDRYLEAELRLRHEAAEAEATHRPTLAQELRRKAGVCHRAALAEETNPDTAGLEPRG